MFSRKLPACPYHWTSKVCLFALLGTDTEVVLVTVFPDHGHRSLEYHSPPCLEAHNPDRSCEEVLDQDLASYMGLEEEVGQRHLVLRRTGSTQREDCCG